MRQSVRVTHIMKLPPEVDDRAARRTGRPVPYRVVSVISLRRGARFVEIETSVNNTVKDHRLRALFPTGCAPTRHAPTRPSTSSAAPSP